MEVVVDGHPDGMVGPECKYEQDECQNDHNVDVVGNVLNVILGLIYTLVLHRYGGASCLRYLATGTNYGRRIKYLHLYIADDIRIIVVQNEGIKSVAVVDDGIIEVSKHLHQQSRSGPLLQPQHLIDLFSDIHCLAELHLHCEFKIIDELSSLECQWLNLAVSNRTTYACLGTVEELRSGAGWTFG